ncbi:DUF1349 domain-containing protein [Paenibacillus enshidis]|uniref:DUF1349 domain-containing protein n=1 Tax=Paenibacillus enshidis TaxID=1458439 RepID=A0ABV5ASZ6_9BACL
MKKWILNEKFDNENLNSQLEWRCEPNEWFLDKAHSQLVLETDAETDFWQRTHYGFQADNGHFLSIQTNQNFRMTTKVQAFPKSKYDQAGLMIRYLEDVWVKTSLEYIPDGPSKLGAVVTNHGYSDWSTQNVDYTDVNLYFRISKIAQNCYVDFSWNGEDWNQIRIAHMDIPDNEPVLAGLYACSPQGKGQVVYFDFLSIEEISDDTKEAYL